MKAWSSVEAEARSFLLRAAPGSRFEIYCTGNVAGHPSLLFARTITRARPKERRALAAAAEDELARLREMLIEKPPLIRGSFVVEDMRRLAGRGQSFASPSVLISYTDGEQWSPFLKDKQILAALAADKGAAPEEGSARTQSLIARLSRHLPPLAHPPRQIYLVYLSPRPEQGALRGDESEMRTQFLRDVLASWGTPSDRIVVEEPPLQPDVLPTESSDETRTPTIAGQEMRETGRPSDE